MRRRIGGILVLLALVLVIPSCSRLEPPAAGNLPRETLREATTLPADWGNLVSVTSSAMYPDLLQLWFQDSAGNVRMVVYSLPNSQFLHVTLIRRQ
jgi:hypothetical protein